MDKFEIVKMVKDLQDDNTSKVTKMVAKYERKIGSFENRLQNVFPLLNHSRVCKTGPWTTRSTNASNPL